MVQPPEDGTSYFPRPDNALSDDKASGQWQSGVHAIARNPKDPGRPTADVVDAWRKETQQHNGQPMDPDAPPTPPLSPVEGVGAADPDLEPHSAGPSQRHHAQQHKQQPSSSGAPKRKEDFSTAKFGMRWSDYVRMSLRVRAWRVEIGAEPVCPCTVPGRPSTPLPELAPVESPVPDPVTESLRRKRSLFGKASRTEGAGRAGVAANGATGAASKDIRRLDELNELSDSWSPADDALRCLVWRYTGVHSNGPGEIPYKDDYPDEKDAPPTPPPKEANSDETHPAPPQRAPPEPPGRTSGAADGEPAPTEDQLLTQITHPASEPVQEPRRKKLFGMIHTLTSRGSSTTRGSISHHAQTTSMTASAPPHLAALGTVAEPDHPPPPPPLRSSSPPLPPLRLPPRTAPQKVTTKMFVLDPSDPKRNAFEPPSCFAYPRPATAKPPAATTTTTTGKPLPRLPGEKHDDKKVAVVVAPGGRPPSRSSSGSTTSSRTAKAHERRQKEQLAARLNRAQRLLDKMAAADG